MFDIGFSEIFVIAVVALLVLGPERLPKAAKFAGLWVRRARAQWYSVKSEFERELADDELKRSLLDARDNLRDAGDALREGSEALRRDLESSTGEVRRSLSGMAAAATTAGSSAGSEPTDGPAPERLEAGAGEPVHADATAADTADAPDERGGSADARTREEDTHAPRS
ncbi:Sec-independent protein translocase protein TatB [Marilutibacter aestuarii]|uniref:Sec-independent protein translocase protein TatB n=1 Tax=Marilutibacter aestuarii TaxID=1706195 RepID=A0A508A684_9GAMM|nr:Sec-independent protein translocase protein TatB [Lysobacter aestuarii]TQD45410.1 twin-arginine translocase subunit TatB [Lysobacter aestuarii]